jgi:N-acetylglucosaminyldiphosphoundecaprenol N-acetyl-beta-D-mannosaminyltransferase
MVKLGERRAGVHDGRVRVSGVPVTRGSTGDVLEGIAENICGERRPQYISITNTESMYYARRIREHAEFIEGATFSCCDGVGVVLAGRSQGVAVERIYGTDLVERCCEFGVKHGWRHFFYGGRPGVAEMMKRNLETRHPGLITAGVYSPPFRKLSPDEDEDVVEMINNTKPDIVWVGLGLLKQEHWIAEHMGRLRAPWMVGVGAAFDYHAGTVKCVAPWVHRTGIYWLYRLCHEPRMLIRNYRSFVFLGESLFKRI